MGMCFLQWNALSPLKRSSLILIILIRVVVVWFHSRFWNGSLILLELFGVMSFGRHKDKASFWRLPRPMSSKKVSYYSIEAAHSSSQLRHSRIDAKFLVKNCCCWHSVLKNQLSFLVNAFPLKKQLWNSW